MPSALPSDTQSGTVSLVVASSSLLRRTLVTTPLRVGLSAPEKPAKLLNSAAFLPT